MTKGENEVKFSNENENEHTRSGALKNYFVVCKPRLDSLEEGSIWKVTIDVLDDGENGFVYLGIVGNIDHASIDSTYPWDSTSHGWATGGDVFNEGGALCIERDEWAGFIQGECLHFHLKSNTLTMFSVQKNKKFIMDIQTPVDVYYINFVMANTGTSITLEPLDKEEGARLLQKPNEKDVYYHAYDSDGNIIIY